MARVASRLCSNRSLSRCRIGPYSRRHHHKTHKPDYGSMSSCRLAGVDAKSSGYEFYLVSPGQRLWVSKHAAQKNKTKSCSHILIPLQQEHFYAFFAFVVQLTVSLPSSSWECSSTRWSYTRMRGQRFRCGHCCMSRWRFSTDGFLHCAWVFLLLVVGHLFRTCARRKLLDAFVSPEMCRWTRVGR